MHFGGFSDKFLLQSRQTKNLTLTPESLAITLRHVLNPSCPRCPVGPESSYHMVLTCMISIQSNLHPVSLGRPSQPLGQYRNAAPCSTVLPKDLESEACTSPRENGSDEGGNRGWRWRQRWEPHRGQEKGGSETSNAACRAVRRHRSALSRGLGLVWPTPHPRPRFTERGQKGQLDEVTGPLSTTDWFTRHSFWCTEALEKKTAVSLSAACKELSWVRCEKASI